MKKLMIAAALVAMIGAAEATTYKFTATLKTTSEKQGKEGKTATYNYACVDSTGGVYWWSDSVFLEGGKFESLVSTKTKKRNGISYTVKTIKQADVNKLSVADQEELKTALDQYPSRDKYGDYCVTLYFKTPSICYRAPKTKKYTTTLWSLGCCDGNIGPTSFYDLDVNAVDCTTDGTQIGSYSAGGFHWIFAYRINGQNASQSKTIEACAQMAWEDISSWDFGTVANDFALAGQGTFDTNRGVIKSFSGKIVGALAAPLCGCCDAEKESRVFSCDGQLAADYGTDDSPVLPGFLTAAFGDFSISYQSAN